MAEKSPNKNSKPKAPFREKEVYHAGRGTFTSTRVIDPKNWFRKSQVSLIGNDANVKHQVRAMIQMLFHDWEIYPLLKARNEGAKLHKAKLSIQMHHVKEEAGALLS